MISNEHADGIRMAVQEALSHLSAAEVRDLTFEPYLSLRENALAIAS